MSSPDAGVEITTIRTMAIGAAPRVGDVIADSHAHYPAFSHLFPDRAQRGRVLERLMTGVARDAAVFGAVTVAVQGERMLGAAVWLPTGTFPWTTWRKLKASTTPAPVANPRSHIRVLRSGCQRRKDGSSGATLESAGARHPHPSPTTRSGQQAAPTCALPS
jgi:hypothetical protein